jgi:hypothetical protein
VPVNVKCVVKALLDIAHGSATHHIMKIPIQMGRNRSSGRERRVTDSVSRGSMPRRDLPCVLPFERVVNWKWTWYELSLWKNLSTTATPCASS